MSPVEVLHHFTKSGEMLARPTMVESSVNTE
jgi:hypothetical protein